MEANNKIVKRPVDNDPVECCSNCKSLKLIQENNDIKCGICGHTNSVEILDNIHEYIDNYGMLWNIQSYR